MELNIMQKINVSKKIISSLLITSTAVSVFGFTNIHAISKKAKTAIFTTIPTVVIAGALVYTFYNNKSSSGEVITESKPEPKQKNNSEFNRWVDFLKGMPTPNLCSRFDSCEEFRNLSDDKLEQFHDYVQIVFPNLERSKYANQNLYLKKNLNDWKKLLSDKTTRCEIQKNLKQNLIRMLRFWKFEVFHDRNFNITKLTAGDSGQPFENDNHNALRMTRVLLSLKLFGLNNEHKLIMATIKKKHRNCSSYSYWRSTENTRCLFY